MSVSGTRGWIALGIQSQKGTLSGNMKRIRALNEAFGLQEMTDAIPPEVSGKLFTEAVYKQGVFGAGAITMIPRLGDSIAYPLYAITGLYASASASATGNGYKHDFKVNESDQTSVPWLTIQKYIPDSVDATTGKVEQYKDARLVSTTITLPQSGTLAMETAFIAREPSTPASGQGETALGPLALTSSYDTGDSIALSCVSTITSALANFSAASASLMSAQIIMANQFTTPQQEMVIGSYYPDDFIPLGRSAAVRLVYKWQNDTMYNRLVYNGVDATNGAGVAWSPIIQSGSVTITAKSAGDMGGGISAPYSLVFTAPEVRWTAGPIQLASQRMLMMEITGVVLNDPAGTNTYKWTLENKKAPATYTFS